jgi:DNA-binding transcriptional LysR family regulator
MHCKIRRYFRQGTLIQLRVLDAIVRLGSFTRAGEELHMAQPTVSVHMKKLGETIGAPLLEIVGKRVRLTAAGEKVHAAGQRIFEAITELDTALNAPSDSEGDGGAAPPGKPPLRRAACFRSVCRRS